MYVPQTCSHKKFHSVLMKYVHRVRIRGVTRGVAATNMFDDGEDVVSSFIRFPAVIRYFNITCKMHSVTIYN